MYAHTAIFLEPERYLGSTLLMLVSDVGAQALLCNILHAHLRSHLMTLKAKSQMKAKEVPLLCSHWKEMASHFVPWTPKEGKGDGMKKLTFMKMGYSFSKGIPLKGCFLMVSSIRNSFSKINQSFPTFKKKYSSLFHFALSTKY